MGRQDLSGNSNTFFNLLNVDCYARRKKSRPQETRRSLSCPKRDATAGAYPTSTKTAAVLSVNLYAFELGDSHSQRFNHTRQLENCRQLFFYRGYVASQFDGALHQPYEDLLRGDQLALVFDQLVGDLRRLHPLI